MKIKNIVLTVLIVVWASFIFLGSNQNSNDSNELSKEIIYNTTKETVTVTNELQITDIELDEPYLKRVVNKWNKPVRKLAHGVEYCILGLLIILLWKNTSKKIKKGIMISVLICFIFSLTDEYHQTKVSGRTGQFQDCLIDATGASVGILLGAAIKRKKKRNKEDSVWRKEKLSS